MGIIAVLPTVVRKKSPTLPNCPHRVIVYCVLAPKTFEEPSNNNTAPTLPSTDCGSHLHIESEYKL